MNVLSIDWDYFVDISLQDRAMLMPDGGTEDVSSNVQNYIWINKYAGDLKSRLPEIGLKKDWMRLMKYLIKHRSKQSVVCISHKHITDYLPNKQCNIINIDYHHDAFDDKEVVHCGNWVTHLKRMNKLNKFIWVRPEEVASDLPCYITQVTDIHIVNNYKYDMIYLCRSDMWSPPHLDRYFNELVRVLQLTTDNTIIQKGIVDRYKDMKDNIELMKKVYTHELDKLNKSSPKEQ